MKRKRHSEEEIATKLRQADDMVARGSRQAEIIRALRISAMTYHRWRKARAIPPAPLSNKAGAGERAVALANLAAISREQVTRASELELENQRLRRLVTDLLLEKIRLEEALQERKPALETVRG
jgi:putative transposase